MARKEFSVVDRNWHDLCSDVNWTDYDGSWARKVTETRYLVIQFENCREWGDGATGYHVSLSEVDLNAPNVLNAYRSSDVPLDGIDEYGEDIPKDRYRLMCVWACHSYGIKAPLFQASGRNVRKLVAAAKREARRLIGSKAEYRKRMARPVNALGSMAREYQRGEIHKAVVRGVLAGDPKAEIMAKLGMARP